MDGPLLEHSDSDSGESWTLLEHNPTFADEAPEFPDIPAESPVPEINEKDEDTDGISIISDSDHEIQMMYEKYLTLELPPESAEDKEIPQYVSVDPHLSSFNTNESLRDDNAFLGDNNKHKIYVHRRNKQLSTVLNIIVLGSVITAAGVAIGHMWGAKNDCSMHNPPAVNKILSNLYKLQEENAYLRNKIKELSHYHQSQQKLPTKQNRCKKMFEEPLNNKNINRLTKCMDDKDNKGAKLGSDFIGPLYQKEFISDVNKLENIYQENKSWLDGEITKRLKVEEEMWNNNINRFKSDTTDEKSKLPDHVNYESSHINTNSQSHSLDKPFIKISYADSLKSDKHIKKINKRDANKMLENDTSRFQNKKKAKGDSEKNVQYTISDEELKKDDRYIGQKNKQEKKKYNHHKSFKKQKRRNKYEQWEMKGGFIKDYDDFSVSSQDIDLKSNMQQTSVAVDKINDISNKFTDTESIQYDKKIQKDKSGKIKKDHQKKDWSEKRVELRKEARKKLEQELFGDMTPNTARWYFRRMLKREQCRSKDNSTNRKVNDKRDLNYKVKH